MSVNTISPADTADLRLAGWADLETAFAEGVEPDPAELDGAYRGRLLSVRGLDLLPSVLRRILDLAFGTVLMPWRGKRFGTDAGGGRNGANVWLTMSGPDLVSFDVVPGDDSLRLDYGVSANPPPLRGIRGDVRRLAPGLYLGRMGVEVGGRTTPVLWFSLDNA